MVADSGYYGEESTDYLQLDPYESEETLSLCDLPTYSSDYYSKLEDQSYSVDEDDDRNSEFFEFFSDQDFSTSSFLQAENVIFCGKIIPYKQPHAGLPAKSQIQIQQEMNSHKKNPTSSLFRWKSTAPRDSTGRYSTFSESKQLKVSIMASSPVKSRWYLLMFGIGKIPMEMELRDMKTRQWKRTPSTSMFRFSSSSEGKDRVHSNGVVKGMRNGGKGLSRILRNLGCRRASIQTAS